MKQSLLLDNMRFCGFQNLVWTPVYGGHNLPPPPVEVGWRWLPKLGVANKSARTITENYFCWFHIWSVFALVEILQTYSTKGQLNSEWIFEAFVSPKLSNKNLKDFCPESLLLAGIVNKLFVFSSADPKQNMILKN